MCPQDKIIDSVKATDRVPSIKHQITTSTKLSVSESAAAPHRAVYLTFNSVQVS